MTLTISPPKFDMAGDSPVAVEVRKRRLQLMSRKSRPDFTARMRSWLAEARADFGFEKTLGITYVKRLRRWKQAGYRVEIVYLRLRSTQLALRRIAARVHQDGHNVPRKDVIRRFKRGWDNFEGVPFVGGFLGGVREFGSQPTAIGTRTMKAKISTRKHEHFATGVGRALRRAAKDAQKVARMYGTPIYVWEGGKVVAKKP
jgi:hypothetical protein